MRESHDFYLGKPEAEDPERVSLRKPEAQGKTEKSNKYPGFPGLKPHLRQEQVASHFLAGVVFGMSITDLMQFEVVKELLPGIAD